MWYPQIWLNIYMAVRFLRISVSKIITKSRKFQIMAVDAFMFNYKKFGTSIEGLVISHVHMAEPCSCSVAALSGAPSPPPPPPLFKGHSLSITDSLLNRKSNKLKPLLWSSLKSAEQGSMWAEMQNPDEAQVLEINMSELESLFLRESREEEQAAARFLPPQIDRERAHNCTIMLSNVKIPFNELMDHVLALDNSVLDADQLDNITQFCPTKEEMDQLKDYKGDKDELGKCEQFFLELMKVPRAEYKLIAFSYMLRFKSRVSELRQCLNICQSAIEQIRSSAKLKRVMQTLLCLGNALNQGTTRGGAVGFRLDTLLKLTDTRARNSRMTLMHYLCKVLADKLPEVLDFSKDLGSLEPASKMQLKLLAEKMQVNTRGWCRVVEEKRFAKKEGRASKKFRKGLKEFVCSADNEVRSLVSLYTTLVQNAYALARYFDEDPAICTYEQIVLTMLEFTRVFNQAIEENTKQLEAEKVASNPQMKS